jgi:quercetin dioxygenase-like cupin family protein
MKLNRLVILFLTGLSITACKNNIKTDTMTKTNNTAIFPKGKKLTNGYFTGDAYLMPLLPKDSNNNFAMGSVTFEPGARTNWHTHPKGQVLIVTEGQGWYQEKGKPAHVIKKGDVINIPANIEHWHGASADNAMIHIAITNYEADENVIWLKPVSDEDYAAVSKK